jgi:hypothetical protein
MLSVSVPPMISSGLRGANTPQAWAITFVDHVVQKFPFRIHTVRTDRGHELQALFWHLADQGIRHVYIKARTPQSMGRSSARTARISRSSISS